MSLSGIKELNRSLKLTWSTFLTIIGVMITVTYTVTLYLTSIDHDKIERERIESNLRNDIKEVKNEIILLKQDIKESKEYLNNRMDRKIDNAKELLFTKIDNLEK